MMQLITRLDVSLSCRFPCEPAAKLAIRVSDRYKVDEPSGTARGGASWLGRQGSIPFGACVNRAFALAIVAGGIDSFINLPDLGRPQ